MRPKGRQSRAEQCVCIGVGRPARTHLRFEVPVADVVHVEEDQTGQHVAEHLRRPALGHQPVPAPRVEVSVVVVVVAVVAVVGIALRLWCCLQSVNAGCGVYLHGTQASTTVNRIMGARTAAPLRSTP